MSASTSMPAPRPTGRARVSRRALGGFALAAALLAGAVGAPAAHAATPSPLAALSQALRSATSYQVNLTVTSASTGPITGTVVFVRGKSGPEAHVMLMTSATGTPTKIDAVIVGSRVCVKLTPAMPYRCQNSPSAAAQLNLDPSATFVRAGRSTTFTPTQPKQKLVQNTLCDGYRFTTTASGAHAHGTIYLNHNNGRPREEDVTTTAVSATTGKTITAQTTAIWVNYNSKTLTIPTIPPA